MIKCDPMLTWSDPCLGSTWQQFASGHGRRPVALVLHEGEASVLGFVRGAGVHDDVHDPVGDLLHLGQDLLAFLGFGNPAHKQAAVVNAGTNPEEAAISVGMKKTGPWSLVQNRKQKTINCVELARGRGIGRSD